MTRMLAVAAAVLVAVPVLAEAPKPVTETNVTRTKGTIEAINSTTREVSVKVNGVVHRVKVKPDVKRFSELKVGDALTVEYHEAVLMDVRKAGAAAPAPVEGGDQLRVAGKGEKPSGTIVQQQVQSVVVKDIDVKTPSIQIEMPNKDVVRMKVEHPERLLGLKVGDTIDITYTEALTIWVE